MSNLVIVIETTGHLFLFNSKTAYPATFLQCTSKYNEVNLKFVCIKPGKLLLVVIYNKIEVDRVIPFKGMTELLELP